MILMKLRRPHEPTDHTWAHGVIEEVANFDDMVDRAKVSVFILLKEVFGVPAEEILSKSRKRDIVQARHIGMYLLHICMGLSQTATGKVFGRDHSTVINAVKKINNDLDVSQVHKDDLDNYYERLKALAA